LNSSAEFAVKREFLTVFSNSSKVWFSKIFGVFADETRSVAIGIMTEILEIPQSHEFGFNEIINLFFEINKIPYEHQAT
jgi:hypothetical protein